MIDEFFIYWQTETTFHTNYSLFKCHQIFLKRIWDEQFVNTFCRQWRSNSCRGKQLPSSRVEGFLVGGRRAWSRVCSRPDVEEERVGVTRLDSRLWLVPNSHFHGWRNLERNQTIGWNGPMENNKVNWLNTVNIMKHTQFVNTERVILRKIVQVVRVHVYSPNKQNPQKNPLTTLMRMYLQWRFIPWSKAVHSSQHWPYVSAGGPEGAQQPIR